MGYKCIDFPMLDTIISIYGIKTGYVGMEIFLFYFEIAIKITGSMLSCNCIITLFIGRLALIAANQLTCIISQNP